ncbi:MAG: hypothetical protein ACR2HN_02590 [Tepidiformaceae bacterium]
MLLPHPRLLFALLALVVASATFACGEADDDDDDADGGVGGVTPAASSSATAAVPATRGPATPTPAATPNPAVEALASRPGYFIYVIGLGDTWDTIGSAFAVPPATIRADNPGQGAAPVVGSDVAIRLSLPGTLAIIPEVALEQALGISSGAAGLRLLQPSLALRDFYRNRIVLHRVAIADANAPGEGRGYAMEYFLADRVPFKGGSPDPDAKVAERLFVIAGGSLARTVAPGAPGTLHGFMADGVDYAVQAATGAMKSAAEIAAMLEPASRR